MGELLSTASIVFVVWLIHFTLAMVLASPFLLWGDHRPRWNGIDALALFLPFALWAVCMLADQRPESGEKATECLLISALIAVAAAIRVLAGPRRKERLFSTILVASLCLVALAIYRFAPPLPIW